MVEGHLTEIVKAPACIADSARSALDRVHDASYPDRLCEEGAKET